ncbi:unnamed protein product, partial [Polarella glacialis]
LFNDLDIDGNLLPSADLDDGELLSADPAGTTVQSVPTGDQILCPWIIGERGCKYEDGCRYSHAESDLGYEERRV